MPGVRVISEAPGAPHPRVTPVIRQPRPNTPYFHPHTTITVTNGAYTVFYATCPVSPMHRHAI